MRASEFSASQRREGEQKRKCPSCAALSAEERERLHVAREASLCAAGQDFVVFGAAWCFAIWGQEVALLRSRPSRGNEESAWSHLACRALRYARVRWRLSC